MDINNIRFPDFKEKWSDYCHRCPEENPYHFVLVDNAILTQYIDGYLYPVPFDYKEQEVWYKNSVNDKIRFLNSMMTIYSKGAVREVNTRVSENYPPYCMLFTIPNNKDLLTVMLRISDIHITEMTYIGYCEDYDCYVGSIRLPYGHGEDEKVYLLSKESGEFIKTERNYKASMSFIRDNGIFVGTFMAGINNDDGRLCKGVRVSTINMDHKPYKTATCIYFQ